MSASARLLRDFHDAASSLQSIYLQLLTENRTDAAELIKHAAQTVTGVLGVVVVSNPAGEAVQS
jgi:hypothetical protein